MTPEAVSDLMRSFAAQRRKADRPCAVCGKLMPQVIGKRRYCSGTCHSRAAWLRRREKERTADAASPP